MQIYKKKYTTRIFFDRMLSVPPNPIAYPKFFLSIS